MLIEASQLGWVFAVALGALVLSALMGAGLSFLVALVGPPVPITEENEDLIAEKQRETEQAEIVDRQGLSSAYRQGVLVLVALAALTALEFWVSAGAGGSTVILFLIGLLKAGAIVQYFMHVARLWLEEAHG